MVTSTMRLDVNVNEVVNLSQQIAWKVNKIIENGEPCSFYLLLASATLHNNNRISRQTPIAKAEFHIVI